MITSCRRTSNLLSTKRYYDDSKSGSFGRYFKITKYRGIKIFEREFVSPAHARTSIEYKHAVKELKILNTLTERGCKITPKGYAVRIINYRGRYHVGLVMKHMGNQILAHTRKTEKQIEFITQNLKDVLLQKYRVLHGDLHDHNVIVKRNSYYVIDFTPVHINVKKLLN